MRVGDIAALGFERIVEGDAEREVTGCYSGDLLSWVMGRAKSGDAWVTIMQNANVAAVALLTDVSCVILAENVAPDAPLVDKARANGIALFRSELPAFETAVKLYEGMK